MINISYLTILKFSFEIIFSISFFGAGKSILLRRKKCSNCNKNNKTQFYEYAESIFTITCIFSKLHITLVKIKLRHICVFSIQKLMKSKKNLVLLGMMGSGKSSIGSIISKKLNINFIDIDQEIEKKLEMKISDIFKIKGEKFFQRI